MAAKRCLGCYEPTTSAEGDYHPRCRRRVFGSADVPQFPRTMAEIKELAERVVRSRVSITGVQPKLSLDIEKLRAGASRFTIVGLQGRYVLKPPVPFYPDLPELEDVTMHMAAAAGIQTVPHCLLKMGSGERAFLCRRVDRDSEGKLAQEDMCQLLGRLTEDKYKGSLEQVGRAVLRYSSNPGYDAVRLLELCLFCFLTANSDMHLKNYSLLTRRVGAVGLCPAYDLVPTQLVLPQDREESALTINGKKANLKRADFDAFADALRVNVKARENAYGRILGAVAAMLDLLSRGFVPAQTAEKYDAVIRARRERFVGA